MKFFIRKYHVVSKEKFKSSSIYPTKTKNVKVHSMCKGEIKLFRKEVQCWLRISLEASYMYPTKKN